MFTHDLPASKLAALSDVSHRAINQRFFKLRRLLLLHRCTDSISARKASADTAATSYSSAWIRSNGRWTT